MTSAFLLLAFLMFLLLKLREGQQDEFIEKNKQIIIVYKKMYFRKSYH
ncbi:MAG: hypothetical protein K8S23_12100 [Candidatus Cloacimonetes bacterium]|nr:hypothetical protein [Candidatus Cloacimonadota bacterium]